MGKNGLILHGVQLAADRSSVAVQLEKGNEPNARLSRRKERAAAARLAQVLRLGKQRSLRMTIKI